MNHETENIDKLFLELSQFTGATTAKELQLQSRIDDLIKAIKPFAFIVKNSDGRIPTERLSLADWHLLTRTYTRIWSEANEPPPLQHTPDHIRRRLFWRRRRN